jgi:hypothetical protein
MGPPHLAPETLPAAVLRQDCQVRPRSPRNTGHWLIHGVVSHAPHRIPLEHAWVELPGEVVFDTVVQAFFTRVSYYTVMAAVALDAYSAPETTRLLRQHRHPGPWNAKWVPTLIQLEAYVASARVSQPAWLTAPLPLNVGRKR